MGNSIENNNYRRVWYSVAYPRNDITHYVHASNPKRVEKIANDRLNKWNEGLPPTIKPLSARETSALKDIICNDLGLPLKDIESKCLYGRNHKPDGEVVIVENLLTERVENDKPPGI